MSVRKASVLELATAAYDLDASVMRGRLIQIAGWKLDDHGRGCGGLACPNMEGQEIVLIAASMDDTREVSPRTCPRCGREYTGAYCPHCREARLRLRGR